MKASVLIFSLNWLYFDALCFKVPSAESPEQIDSWAAQYFITFLLDFFLFEQVHLVIMYCLRNFNSSEQTSMLKKLY
jgi:hypothetical protein